MKEFILTAIWGFTILSSNAQLNDKQHIFSYSDKISMFNGDAKLIRFTPTIDEVNIADSLSYTYINNNRNEYYWTKETIDYPTYYRQYFGYFSEEGEKIIFVNSFCRTDSNWTRELISTKGGGSCYYNLKVNINRNKPFDLMVNAPK